jgi:hypothetical protein
MWLDYTAGEEEIARINPLINSLGHFEENVKT